MKDSKEQFLDKLTSKKMEFERALQRLMKNQREYRENPDEGASMDESDQAQREISVSSNYSLIERKARELKQIERLIRKITSNSHFGICEECGDPIPAERLLIVPEAALCVPCQRELEKFDHFRKFSSQKAYKLSVDKFSDDEETFHAVPSDEDLIDPDLEILPLIGLEDIDTPDLNQEA